MAQIEHIVTDMGNGAAYCGDCKRRLGSDPFSLPEFCPGCSEPLVESGNVFIPTGGSDF